MTFAFLYDDIMAISTMDNYVFRDLFRVRLVGLECLHFPEIAPCFKSWPTDVNAPPYLCSRLSCTVCTYSTSFSTMAVGDMTGLSWQVDTDSRSLLVN